MKEAAENTLNILSSIKKTFEKQGLELPKLNGFIPNTDQLLSGKCRLMIVDFKTGPDTNGYGEAVCDTVRMIMADLRTFGFGSSVFVPKIPLGSTFTKLTTPAEDNNQSANNRAVRTLVEGMSIDYALLGEVREDESKVNFDFMLVDVANDRVKEQLKLELTTRELVPIVKKLLMWLIKALKLKAGKDSAKLIAAQLIEDEIAEYAQIVAKYTYRGAYFGKTKLAKKFEDYHSVLMAFYYLHQNPITLITRYRFKDTYQIVSDRFNNHAYLLLELVPDEGREMIDEDVLQEKAAQNVLLKKVLSKRELHTNELRDFLLKRLSQEPDNLTLALTAVEFLNSRGEMKKALALIVAMITTNRQMSELWAQLTQQLNEIAFQYRGDDWWENVPAKNQLIFSELSEVAILVTEHAMSVFPDDESLMLERMELEHGTSELLINLFLRANELNPHSNRVYQKVLHYTQPRWCGWYELQLAILALAHQQNPSEKWPQKLYAEYVQDNDDYNLFERCIALYHRFIKKDWYKLADSDVKSEFYD